MSRAGSDPFVEQVRSATDVVGLIGAQVELKRVGNRFRGLCPFHREKTPSFYVSPDHQTYHCFGCGEGGDAFSFLMAHEKLSFPEALQYLAEKAGIALPERRGPSGDTVERIRAALKIARGFYRERLLGAAGADARAYLQKRGIGTEIAERYGLGVAPDAWDGLLSYARRFVSERALIEAGLAIEADGGRVYDRFRNRLMIPIDSPSGTPVGFGGRILGPEEPKYLNSPETAVYRKGTTLFGWREARDAMREASFVAVVEGYFDVIAFAQAGLGAAVGSCGTALTPEQCTMLHRIGRTVIFLFDGDGAGFRAALRALPIAVGVIDDVRVAFPPAGLDPDLWVREHGAEAVQAALLEARAPLAFLEEQVSLGTLPKRDAVDRAAEILANLSDPLHREMAVQEASGRFGLRPEAFEEKLRAARGAAKTGAPEVRPPARAAGAAPARQSASGSTGASSEPWKRFESQCLISGLSYPEEATAMAEALERAGSKSPAPGLLRWIGEAFAENPEEGSVRSLLARATHECEYGAPLNALAMRETSPAILPSHLLARLETWRIERRMEALNGEIRRAGESGNRDEEARLLAEKQELARAKARLARAQEEGPEGYVSV
ncbi:MAG: DNA primase [Candidatus Eisenbacteria bacterium]|nr:DNA primase [Candidatus Eisenbacteria bacterium]